MGNIAFLLEFLVFSGAALAWAFWELWSVRDAGTQPGSETKDGATQSPDASGHPER